MPADTNPPQPSGPMPHAAVDLPDGADRPDPPGSASIAVQAHHEMEILQCEGLPPDAMILVPSVTAAPMRQPENSWAMLVLAAHLGETGPGGECEVALFAGRWLWGPDQPPANLCEGALVLELTAPHDECVQDGHVDVRMLLAYRSRWLQVGEWPALDLRWPCTVAVTAAAVMSLCLQPSEVAARYAGKPVPPGQPLRGWRRTVGMVDLLAAGLVLPGDEFVWDRPRQGLRHAARVRSDGGLQLADGRVFANPSGALTAVGGNHQNGWTSWRRTSDGRSLGDLRAELRTQREFA